MLGHAGVLVWRRNGVLHVEYFQDDILYVIFCGICRCLLPLWLRITILIPQETFATMAAKSPS